mgnify:CR=1 FL=1
MLGSIWRHLQAPAVTLRLRGGVRVWVTYMGCYCAALLLAAVLAS